MNTLLQKLQNKLGEIQNSNEASKKRWLIGLSAAAMTLVVALWIAYMNFTIASFDRDETDLAREASIERRDFSALASNALYNTRNLLAKLFSKFGSTNKIEINKEFNFIAD